MTDSCAIAGYKFYGLPLQQALDELSGPLVYVFSAGKSTPLADPETLETLYAGQATEARTRLTFQHEVFQDPRSDTITDVLIHHAPAFLLDSIERAVIRALRPPLNQVHNAGFYRPPTPEDYAARRARELFRHAILFSAECRSRAETSALTAAAQLGRRHTRRPLSPALLAWINRP